MGRLLTAITILFLSTGVFGTSNGDLLQRAQGEFDIGNFKKAGKSLVKLLKKQPKNDKALMLLGQVYFQLGKFRKARETFDKMNPKALTKQAGYAWGASFYGDRKWKKAVYGFKKVPRKSQYRSLAAYFLGVCYYRMKRWYPAKKFLLKADPLKLLPVMKRNKEKMLVIIKKKRDEEFKSILNGGRLNNSATGARAVVIQPIPVQQYVFQGEKVEKSSAKQSNFLVKPDIRYTQLSRTLENHGFVNESLGVTAHKESVQGTLVDSFGKSNTNNYGIRGELGFGEVQFDSTVAAFVSLEQTTGAFVQSTETSISESFLIGAIEPFLTLALSRKINVQLFLSANQFNQQNSGTGAWGSYMGQSTVQFISQPIELTLALNGGERFDDSLGASTQEVSASANFSWQKENFSAAVDGKFTNRTGDIYQSPNPYRRFLSSGHLEPMDGYGVLQNISLELGANLADFDFRLGAGFVSRSENPLTVVRARQTDLIETYSESVAKSEITVSYPIFDGFALFGKGGVKFIGGHTFELRDPNGGPSSYYLSDAEQTGGGFGAIVQPFDWLTLDASLGFHTTTYQPNNFQMSDDFKKSNPDFANYSNFYLNLFYEF